MSAQSGTTSSAMPEPKAPLLSLDEALARLTAGATAARITEVETVSTFDALGRVLALDVVSAIDLPPADNSSMDGYALRVADASAVGALLPISQRIPAGAVSTALLAEVSAVNCLRG